MGGKGQKNNQKKKMLILNDMFLNSQEVTEEIKMGIKKYLETNESKKN